jgi:hypothetical protein
MVCDAADASVMIEGIGWRSSRWMQIKEKSFAAQEAKRGSKEGATCVARQTPAAGRLESFLRSGSLNSRSIGEDRSVQHEAHVRLELQTKLEKNANCWSKTGCDRTESGVPSRSGSSGEVAHQERLHDIILCRTRS